MTGDENRLTPLLRHSRSLGVDFTKPIKPAAIVTIHPRRLPSPRKRLA